MSRSTFVIRFTKNVHHSTMGRIALPSRGNVAVAKIEYIL
jgi:hypothetical protein